MTTRLAILSVNAGSSSLKFALYPVYGSEAGTAAFAGQAEGLEPGGRPRMAYGAAGEPRSERALQPQGGESSFEAALRGVMDATAHAGGWHIVAVAHRVVHGGARYRESVIVDDAVLAHLATLEPLAPLHQPHNLDGVRACRKAFPDLPQVACFDTAFHAGAPEHEQRLALPDSFWDEGVRRYGFHGLSYAYVSATLARHTPQAAGRMLLAHLGNGASLCAVKGGRSIGSTMGFSALDGLMMGTRCGSLDAGVLLHLLRQGRTVDDIERLLYKQSGLLGVSGLSADMRTLRATDAPGARRALQLFTHRVIRESGALVACLGGLDLLGFTGGIGEHDVQLRHDVADGLAHLGVRLDAQANRAATGDEVCAIHAADSTVQVWVVPTDEGRVAARDTLALLKTQSA